MPLYEYNCNKCKKNFEELVLKQSDIPKCPYCGSIDTKKLLSAFRFSSDSSGSYDTDYSAPSSGGGGCSGCAGGNCSSCK